MPDLELTFVDAGTLVVRPHGHLDAELGRVLLRAVSTAVAVHVPRLVVDFRCVRSCSDEALVAVTGCHRLAQRLPDRLSVVGTVALAS